MTQPCRDVEQHVEEDHGGHANPDPVLFLRHTPAAEDGRLQSDRTGPPKHWSQKLMASCGPCAAWTLTCLLSSGSQYHRQTWQMWLSRTECQPCRQHVQAPLPALECWLRPLLASAGGSDPCARDCLEQRCAQQRHACTAALTVTDWPPMYRFFQRGAANSLMAMARCIYMIGCRGTECR